MYLNKRKLEGLRVLALRLKVESKKCGRAPAGSPQWSMLWDEAEYTHRALNAATGDVEALETLRSMAEHNSAARVALYTLEHYGLAR